MASSAAFSQVICVDPGHPSEVGPGEGGITISEMRANWVVSLLVKKKLVAAGYRVVLTKSTEKQKVLNRDRAGIANQSNADLMVRLHCDATSGTGFAVYVPTKPGKSRGKSGPSAGVISRSMALARIFHATLKTKLQGVLKDNGLLSDLQTAVGAKQGALTGSIYSQVPVLLVEMVRLSNKKDDAFIASKQGQETMANAIVAAVMVSVPKKVNR